VTGKCCKRLPGSASHPLNCHWVCPPAAIAPAFKASQGPLASFTATPTAAAGPGPWRVQICPHCPLFAVSGLAPNLLNSSSWLDSACALSSLNTRAPSYCSAGQAWRQNLHPPVAGEWWRETAALGRGNGEVPTKEAASATACGGVKMQLRDNAAASSPADTCCNWGACCCCGSLRCADAGTWSCLEHPPLYTEDQVWKGVDCPCLRATARGHACRALLISMVAAPRPPLAFGLWIAMRMLPAIVSQGRPGCRQCSRN